MRIIVFTLLVLLINVVNNDQETPLHIASKYKQVKVVQALVYFGANIEAKDKYGNTAKDLMEYFIKQRFVNIILTLYKHNHECIIDILKKVNFSNSTLQYLPYDILSVIADYAGSSGPWIEYGQSSKEAILLGDDSHCCIIA